MLDHYTHYHYPESETTPVALMAAVAGKNAAGEDLISGRSNRERTAKKTTFAQTFTPEQCACHELATSTAMTAKISGNCEFQALSCYVGNAEHGTHLRENMGHTCAN